MEDNQILSFVKDMPDNYIIEKNSYSNFDNALNEKAIIQDGKFVRANNAFLKHYDVSKKELYSTPLKDFLLDVSSNSTGLHLTFPEIVGKILNGKYEEIDFNFSIHNHRHSLNWTAKKIIFRNKSAVHIESFIVQDEFQYGSQIYDLKENLNFQENLLNIGMGHYDVKKKKFFWTDGVYEVLERKPVESDSRKNILLDSMLEDDFAKAKSFFHEFSYENPKHNCLFKIITPKGKTKYVRVFLEAFYNEGHLKRIEYFLKDSSARKAIEDDFALFNESLNLIQSASKIGLYTITQNGFFWSKGVYDIIERKERIDDSTYHILGELCVDEDKPLINDLVRSFSPENSQINFEVRIITENNNFKYLSGVSKAIFNEEGELVSRTGLIQDITEKKDMEDKNFQLSEILRVISPKTKLTFIVTDPEDKYFYDSEFYNVFEFNESDNFSKEMLYENIVDSESFVNKFSKFQEDEEAEFSEVFEYNTPSGTVKTIYSFLEHYKINEKDYLIGFCQDISENVEKEEKLKDIINEKTVLMKEVHHRVKNNLQILNSFLNLEQKFNKNDPERIIHGIKSYIESLALIHEKAYGSDNVGFVNVNTFLEDINSKLCSLFSQINVEFTSSIQEEIFILIDVLTPLSLIVNELTMNSIKHAFPDEQKTKKIYNSLSINEDGICEFIFEDNGVGLPEDFDMGSMRSLGCTIISALTNQLDGTLTVMNTGNGAKFKFEFPVNGKYRIGRN